MRAIIVVVYTCIVLAVALWAVLESMDHVAENPQDIFPIGVALALATTLALSPVIMWFVGRVADSPCIQDREE